MTLTPLGERCWRLARLRPVSPKAMAEVLEALQRVGVEPSDLQVLAAIDTLLHRRPTKPVHGGKLVELLAAGAPVHPTVQDPPRHCPLCGGLLEEPRGRCAPCQVGWGYAKGARPRP